MFALLELLVVVIEVFCHWRLTISFLAGLIPAITLQSYFPDSPWTWFISIPMVVVGAGIGAWWQMHSQKMSPIQRTGDSSPPRAR